MPMVLLENVKNLVQSHKSVLTHLETKLTSFGYRVFWKILNAADHNVPQNRERVFIVAVRKPCNNTFSWPTPEPPISIKTILDPLTADERKADLNQRKPPASQTNARANLKLGYAQLKAQGVDPSKTAVVMDIDSSKLHMMFDKSPCLTSSRAAEGGFWVSCRGRRFTKAEMLKLQGISMKLKQPDSVSDRQWGRIVGNGIPIPMMSRVLSKLLPFAGWQI